MIANTIKRWIYAGQVLLTPGSGDLPTDQSEFTISEVGDLRITFDFPSGPLRVRYDVIEYAISATRAAGGRVRIGSIQGQADPGTFQRFLQDQQGNLTQNASYVVPVLVECGIMGYTMEGSAKGVQLIEE